MARILIIDDEEAVRLTLSQALECEGHTVIEAANGAAGLKRFEVEPVDLVITDILMPDKEGLETIRDLRRLRSDLKIIAISGGGRNDNVNFLEMAGRLGADATLKKPFSIDDLCRVVSTCLDGLARRKGA